MIFYLERTTDNDYLTVALWDLDENPFAEPIETPNNWALNDNWRELGSAIIDIHTGLALEELAAEPSGVGEVLADKSGLWINSGDNRLHFKDPADIDQVIATIDDIIALDPQESVIDFRDFTANEPAAPSVGDRYVNTTTGVSSVTAQAVTANYIYQWNGVDWTEIIPDQGTRLADESTNNMMYFNGASWINLGGLISHNDTSGKQGGTAGEYYHLTAAQHTEVADIVANGHQGLDSLQGGTANEYYHLTAAEHTELTDWMDNVLLDGDGDIHFPDNRGTFFGTGDDLEIFHDGANSHIRFNTGFPLIMDNVSGGVGTIVSFLGATTLINSNNGATINEIDIGADQTIFNNVYEDIDFVIRKDTFEDAFKYDAGADTFDINSDIYLPDDTSIYFGETFDGQIYWNDATSTFNIISLIGFGFIGNGGSGTYDIYDAGAGRSYQHEFWAQQLASAIWNKVVFNGYYTAFNDYAKDIDFIIRKNGSGDALVFDAGNEEFDFYSNISLNESYLYFDTAEQKFIRHDDTGNELEIVSNEDLVFKDQWLSSPIPLSESGETALDAAFSAGSIIGALNELKAFRPIHLCFTDQTNPYVSHNTVSNTVKARFPFAGTTVLGIPSLIKIITEVTGGGTGEIIIYDLTNALTIASVTGVAAMTTAYQSVGTLSNLPAGEAIFEVQLRVSAGGTTIRAGGLKIT